MLDMDVVQPRPRYRVLVRFRWWVEASSMEVVAEVRTAGECMRELAVWEKMATVEGVWWEARQADGSWRVKGRAAA